MVNDCRPPRQLDLQGRMLTLGWSQEYTITLAICAALATLLPSVFNNRSVVFLIKRGRRMVIDGVTLYATPFPPAGAPSAGWGS